MPDFLGLLGQPRVFIFVFVGHKYLLLVVVNLRILLTHAFVKVQQFTKTMLHYLK
jgi:hypothetical protein